MITFLTRTTATWIGTVRILKFRRKLPGDGHGARIRKTMNTYIKVGITGFLDFVHCPVF
jgi:hypothetical protein